MLLCDFCRDTKADAVSGTELIFNCPGAMSPILLRKLDLCHKCRYSLAKAVEKELENVREECREEASNR